MRAVVQRVSRASVTSEGQVVGQIGRGLLVLLGISQGDNHNDLKYVADKVAGLRIFDDDDGKMNLSLQDVNGELLVVSQFTLYGDCRKGRRPSFVAAASPKSAETLYQEFVDYLKNAGLKVATGKFQQMMQVELVNYGPVTLLVDSSKDF